MFLTNIDGNQLENLKYALVGEEKYVFCFCTIWSWDGLIWRVALSQSRGTMHSWWEQALRSSWRPLEAPLSINSWTAPCLKVVEKARGPNSIRNKLFKVFSPLIYPVDTSSFSAQFLWPTEESAGGHGQMDVPQTSNIGKGSPIPQRGNHRCHEVIKSTQSTIPYRVLCMICLEPVGGRWVVLELMIPG